MCEIKERVIKNEYARLSGRRGRETVRGRERESDRGRGRETVRERARDRGREPFILKPPSLSEHLSAPRLNAAPCC